VRLLVCGDRKWNQPELIRHTFLYFLAFHPIEVVIEGEAPGADKMARIEAEKLGIPVLRFPAKWKEFGPGAGHIRNQQMLDEGKPTCVLACHWNIKNSKGTKDMIIRSLASNIPVVLLTGVNYYPLEVKFQKFYSPSDFVSFLAS
jgi:hypothetical protein